jgi:hypothetical protein
MVSWAAPVSLDAVAVALRAGRISPIEKLALIFLANAYADEYGVGRIPTGDEYDDLPRFIGCTPHEATYAVKRLFEAGVLRRVPAPAMLFAEESHAGIWFQLVEQPTLAEIDGGRTRAAGE